MNQLFACFTILFCIHLMCMAEKEKVTFKVVSTCNNTGVCRIMKFNISDESIIRIQLSKPIKTLKTSSMNLIWKYNNRIFLYKTEKTSKEAEFSGHGKDFNFIAENSNIDKISVNGIVVYSTIVHNGPSSQYLMYLGKTYAGNEEIHSIIKARQQNYQSKTKLHHRVRRKRLKRYRRRTSRSLRRSRRKTPRKRLRSNTRRRRFYRTQRRKNVRRRRRICRRRLTRVRRSRRKRITRRRRTRTTVTTKTTQESTTITAKPFTNTHKPTVKTKQPTTSLQTTSQEPLTTKVKSNSTPPPSTDTPSLSTSTPGFVVTTQQPVTTTDTSVQPKTSTVSTSRSTTEKPTETLFPLTTEQSTTRLESTRTTVTTSTTKPDSTSTHVPCQSKYDYKSVLQKSLLFYEAQRSGRLPLTNRISWRGDSTLNDGQDNGVDLVGGYFDGGYHLKMNFPQASTFTLLVWGMLEFQDGYIYGGEYEHGLDAVKWATDYFLKCTADADVIWGQVGNTIFDRSLWTRAEDLPISHRPSYKIDKMKSGSDLAGEIAALFAGSSILFNTTNQTYSYTLLRRAEKVFTYATKNQELYHNSIADAANLYRSSGYEDEIAWSAVWLYKATGKAFYLDHAEYEVRTWTSLQRQPTEFSWDNKWLGVQILLGEVTGRNLYIKKVNNFFNTMQSAATRKTPAGMIYIDSFGANRHAANIAFAGLVASSILPTVEVTAFSKKQINLLLGDAGRSFVVGYGDNPPTKPHHAGSSCPSRTVRPVCNWNDFSENKPNPNVLHGALVGGPDENGFYEDSRSDYIKNQVALDFNAGFQSAIAGLIQLQENGNC